MMKNSNSRPLKNFMAMIQSKLVNARDRQVDFGERTNISVWLQAADVSLV